MGFLHLALLLGCAHAASPGLGAGGNNRGLAKQGVLLDTMMSSMENTSSKFDPTSMQPGGRPVVAILTMPMNPPEDTEWSYIGSSFVRYLSAAGADILPLPYNLPQEKMDELFDQANGLFLTGGHDDVGTHGDAYPDLFMTVAKRLFHKALDLNHADQNFPVWGTCQGMEVMSVIAANDPAILTKLDSMSMTQALTFSPKAGASQLLGEENTMLQPAWRAELEGQPVATQLHNYGVTTSHFAQNGKLSTMFNVLATNRDRDSVEYVAIIEGADGLPFWGTQFHPEIPPWELDAEIAHTPSTEEALKYFADFFVAHCKNFRAFSDQVVETKHLIGAFSPALLDGDLGTGYKFNVNDVPYSPPPPPTPAELHFEACKEEANKQTEIAKIDEAMEKCKEDLENGVTGQEMVDDVTGAESNHGDEASNDEGTNNEEAAPNGESTMLRRMNPGKRVTGAKTAKSEAVETRSSRTGPLPEGGEFASAEKSVQKKVSGYHMPESVQQAGKSRAQQKQQADGDLPALQPKRAQVEPLSFLERELGQVVGGPEIAMLQSKKESEKFPLPPVEMTPEAHATIVMVLTLGCFFVFMFLMIAVALTTDFSGKSDDGSAQPTLFSARQAAASTGSGRRKGVAFATAQGAARARQEVQ